jgi:polysaccharide biosynthesis protein PslG
VTSLNRTHGAVAVFAALMLIITLLAIGGTPTSTGAAVVEKDTTSRQAAKLRHPAFGAAYHALWGNRTNAQRRKVFDKLKRTGATWVRISFPWGLVQPRKPTKGDPGWSKWGFNRVDDVVRMTNQRNLKVSFTLAGTPGWANGHKGSAYLPDNPARYAHAIRYLAHRYRGRVQSWEVWNEVNGGQYLKGATLREYKQLLCKAYPAVHRGSPKARVISAGTGGVDYKWIRRFYAANTKSCFDVLAIHPYLNTRSPYYGWGGRTPQWLVNMHKVRRTMKRHHDAKTPVWFTEFGWANKDYGGTNEVSLRKQAKFAVQMIKITKRRLPYVDRLSWYMAKDEGKPLSQRGLFTYKLHPKPVAHRLRNYLSRFR